MDTPNMGRIVWLNRHGATVPAIVAGVSKDSLDLIAFFPGMTPIPVNAVQFGPHDGGWMWPVREKAATINGDTVVG